MTISILRPQRRLAAAFAIALACTGLAACQDRQADITPTPPPTQQAAAVPEGLERFYNQEVDWQPCEKGEGMTKADSETGYTCARITVPLDYEQPEGQTIEIAVKKRAADGESIGSLFVNPGGPGGSGLDLVDGAENLMTSELLDSYDVVGFDPRGVGQSTAVDCLTDAELDEERSGEVGPATEVTAQEAVAQGQEGAAKCEAKTSTAGLLDHIDTVSAAKDLDVLRAVDKQGVLSYLGYSYGTYLGATYAELFPANVGRLVLDAALDPSLSAAEVTRGQAEGFEKALRAYVEDCQTGSSCPLKGDVDAGVKQIQDFLEVTRTSPIPTADEARPLTRDLAASAVLGALYESAMWGTLSTGLEQAMEQNDGSTLLLITDTLSSRNPDGTYAGNGDEAITAINCLDYPVEGDEAQWDAQAAELEEAGPTFGADLAYSDAVCQGWGHESTRERAPITASGAAPILVVGTTGDPATPYPWAQALASQLDSGRLLTWEGQGHAAYGRGGKCVSSAVDSYLLAGTLPAEGTVCHGQE
ncbi:alpha/beta hydrolase [Actinomyces bowdenii]|uniref:alpha/beta hydrolase n=1 Tax=Actinomyces bowdenii TaxID=131109 RepID=UPI001FD3E26C|nr:alpha/beta hydrolase [Actinomyces bowdenii]